MVLPNSKAVQPDLIGALDLFDQIPQPLRRVFGAAGFVERRRETINPNLHQSPSPNAIIS
jgi:hypothetical protein